MITVSQLRNASSMAEEGKRLARIGVALFVFGGVPGAPILSYLLLARPKIDPLLAQILAFPAIFAIDGLVALLPVGVMLWLFAWLFAELSPARKVVNHFYDSLAKEDYLTAFHYLNPDMRIPRGQQITPMWFTRRALIAESAGGLVTDYSLLCFDGQSFTLKVIRGDSSYTTRLRLRKQGGEWKIMSFSRL